MRVYIKATTTTIYNNRDRFIIVKIYLIKNEKEKEICFKKMQFSAKSEVPFKRLFVKRRYQFLGRIY